MRIENYYELCYSERSEESFTLLFEISPNKILRYAQDDKIGIILLSQFSILNSKKGVFYET